jgi:methyltransferase
VTILYWVLTFVALERLGELAIAQRNSKALLARGALEVAPEQHSYFVLLHAAWLVSMLVFIPKGTVPSWWLLGIFFVLQLARVWVIASLGEYWTTRILTIPSEPLVRRGPYRFMRHPNYAVVILEVVVLPLAFGAFGIAAIFSVLNLALIAWRIRAETPALDERAKN